MSRRIGRRGRWPRAAMALGAVAAIVALVTGWAAPASADPGERISSYEVVFTIRQDGTVHVEETIDYDFGANGRHGIFRDVPVVERGGERDRRYELTGVTVSSPDGAPSQAEVTDAGDDKRIRIGDPDRTVTGRHTYVIGYDLENALTPHSGHDELYWDAVGDAWEVPISGVTVEVRAPAAVTGAVCYTGGAGSRTPCESAAPKGDEASFTHPALSPGQGLTIAVKLPKGSVTVPPPVYTADQDTASTLVGGVAQTVVAVLVLLLIPLVYLYARPRRGGMPDPGPQPTPPEGVRPGPAGALAAGRAGPQHAVATLVDLAARGYLRIEEVGGGRDWRFLRGRDPGPDLSPYEWTLLAALFQGRDVVQLGSLKYRFAATMTAARRQIMQDTVRNGWLRRRPDAQRTRLTMAGGLLLFLAWGPVRALADLPLTGAFFVTGAALLVMGLTLVPLTPAGDELRRRVRAYRTYLSASPVRPPAGGDLEAAVSAELPFAIALGVADGWARRFAALGAPPMPVRWYSGRTHPGDPYFASSFHSFTSSASSTMSASRSSGGGSSSGFSSSGSSGGGGGGGGGGSW